MASAFVGLQHVRHGAARTATLLRMQQHQAIPSVQLMPASLRMVRSLSSLPSLSLRRSSLLFNGMAPINATVSMEFQQRSWFSSSGAAGDQQKSTSSGAGVPLPPAAPIPSLALNKEQDGAAVPDAFKLEKDTWAERHCPKWMVPYIQLSRINRPAGTYMLLWPCFWSISLAAPAGQLPDLGLLALFGTGAFIMRSAGCTINDMWDKDFDKQVERTNKRPLASGAITYLQAWGFLSAQLSAGLGILLQLNWYSIAMGASSLALVGAYPLMKRVTYWPQAFLGLTFNYGAILGWAAVHGSNDWSVVLPLYAGGIAWTIVYDTLYAHQDKKDDQQIGVRSTALLFGENTKPILNAFSAAAIVGFGSAGYAAGLDWPFYMGLLGGASHLVWQVNTAKLDDPENLQQRFGSNKWFGALMFASIVAGKVV